MSADTIAFNPENKKEVSYLNLKNQKSNLHYTCGITTKRATSDGAHLRGLAPMQHSSDETSQRWRAVSDTASQWTGIEPQTFLVDSGVIN